MPRPKTDEKLLKEAAALVEGGEQVTEAARCVGIGARTLDRYLAAVRAGARAKGRGKARPVRGASIRATHRPSGAPTTTADDLALVEDEIAETRAALAEARSDGLGARCASLQDQLRRLITMRRELRPPSPPTEDEEERRYRQDADAVLGMIESGVRAAEEKARATIREVLADHPSLAAELCGRLYPARAASAT